MSTRKRGVRIDCEGRGEARRLGKKGRNEGLFMGRGGKKSGALEAVGTPTTRRAGSARPGRINSRRKGGNGQGRDRDRKAILKSIHRLHSIGKVAIFKNEKTTPDMGAGEPTQKHKKKKKNPRKRPNPGGRQGGRKRSVCTPRRQGEPVVLRSMAKGRRRVKSNQKPGRRNWMSGEFGGNDGGEVTPPKSMSQCHRCELY